MVRGVADRGWLTNLNQQSVATHLLRMRWVQARHSLQQLQQAAAHSLPCRIDGHRMMVVALDGLPVNASQPLRAIRINAGQRVTVAVCPDASHPAGKPAWIRASMEQVGWEGSWGRQCSGNQAGGDIFATCSCASARSAQHLPAPAEVHSGSSCGTVPSTLGTHSAWNMLPFTFCPPVPLSLRVQSVFATDAQYPLVLGVLQYGQQTDKPRQLPTTQPDAVDPGQVGEGCCNVSFF